MDRERLEAAGANYPYGQQQGLYGVPTGLLFVVTGIASHHQSLNSVVLLTVYALVLGVYGLVYLYYSRTLGIVMPTRERRRRYNIAAVTAAVTFGALCLLGWVLIGPGQRVSIVVAAWAVSLLVLQARTVGVRKHHLLISAALLIVAVLPIWPTGPEREAYSYVPIAAAAVITGLVEHVRLVRWFGSYPRPVATDLENDSARA